MEALDLARWQFGITTVYHYLFVPITIGLSLLAAIMQTQWLRTRNPEWLPRPPVGAATGKDRS